MHPMSTIPLFHKALSIIIIVIYLYTWISVYFILWLFVKMSRTQSFTSSDKERDKNPLTPRAKLGHRRVDETGETTYKKVSRHVWKGFIKFCISY